MGVEWAIVAAGLVVLTAAVLGYLAARPAVRLEANERKRAEQRADAAEQALEELGRRQVERQRGAQVDADAEAEAQRALAAAGAGDPAAAALALVRLRRAREDAARTAAGEDGRPAGDVGSGGVVATDGAGRPDRGGTGPGAPVV